MKILAAKRQKLEKNNWWMLNGLYDEMCYYVCEWYKWEKTLL